jgi:sugar lactone lactonase YvrE
MALQIIRLEERIVLDGAGAAVVAEAAEAIDQYAEAAETAENDTDDASAQADDSSEETQDSADTIDGIAADDLAQLGPDTSGDNILTDSTAVLLISDSFENADQLAKAVGDNVLVLRYSPSDMTPGTLLDSIKDVLGNQQVESIGFACCENGENSMELARDSMLSSSTLAVSENQQQFWGEIGSLVKDGGRIDLLCNGLAASDTGELLIHQLEAISGRTVVTGESAVDTGIFAWRYADPLAEATTEGADGTITVDSGDGQSFAVSQTIVESAAFSDVTTNALSDGFNLVLIDTMLEDYQDLASAADEGTHVLFYDGGTASADDVLAQAVDYAIANNETIDSLSIMAHGSSAQFKLGNEWIGSNDLAAHAEAWHALDAVMNDGGNLYLFGCNVAQDSAEGQALLDGLAEATNADVFASDDVTGAGGDWELEAASEGDEAELEKGLDTHLNLEGLDDYAGTLAVNTAPVNTVPGAQSVDEDNTLVFSTGNGNAISVSDSDVGGADLKVTLSVNDGTLTLSQTTGLTFSTGDGTADTTMTFTGTQANINAALEGMSFTPDADFNGAVTLTLTTNDQGNTGTEPLDSDANITTKYTFDVDGTDEIGTNDATLNNGAAVVADAERGNVVETDGFDDYVSVPAAVTNGLSQFSFSFWVKTTENGTDPGYVQRPTLLGIQTDGPSNDFAINTNNGYIGMWTGLSGANQDYLSTTTQINDNEWHQITVSNDGANVSLYVDGDFEASIATGNGLDNMSFSLGAQNGTAFPAAPNKHPHSGRFDDVRFFDRDLTAQEVGDLYSGLSDTDTVAITVNAVNDAPVVNDQSFSVNENSAADTVVGTVVVNDPEAALNKMYWADYTTGKIQRANLDGTNVEDLVTGLTTPLDVSVDDASGKMYWVDGGAGKIQRANLDGTAVEDILTGLSDPTRIALDLSADKIYWTDQEVGAQKIQRANLDGSNVEDLVTSGLSEPRGIALDVAGGKMYWADWGIGKVQRANLDGTNVEDLATGLPYPAAVTLDLSAGKVYWTDSNADKIQRANLDGSSPEDVVVTGLDTPHGLTVDAVGGKLYWTDYGSDTIHRANLDGSAVEDLVTSGLSLPLGIELDLRDSLTYTITGGNTGGAFAIDSNTGKITVANSSALDYETNPTFNLTVQVEDSGALTDTATITIDLNDVNEAPPVVNDQSFSVDENASNSTVVGTVLVSDDIPPVTKMYWLDMSDNNIKRADLDGSNVETLVTGLTDPRSMTVDHGAGKIYWTDYGTDKIQRANLDGSNVEDLITGLTNPTGIALDTTAGKMYWTDYSANTIQRADLDGSNVEDLVTTGLTDPKNIALDTAAGKMYWVDSGSNKVQRADLDGSNVEDLVIGLTDPEGIALDVDQGKMYWSDIGTDKIQRANLDGSNVEDLFTGVGNARAVALDVDTGKIYWGEVDTDQIQRGNMDGSGSPENLIATGDLPYGMALGHDSATLTYSITGGNTGGAFAIHSNTGEITVADSSVLNFETNPTFNLTVQVEDSGALTDTATITINLNDLNEVPTSTDNTVTTPIDAAYTFTAADFNFSDQDSGDSLTKVQIVTLEAAGSLELSGVAVTQGQEIAIADINAGNLKFVPGAGESGDGYADFQFKVHDGTQYSEATSTVSLVNASFDADAEGFTYADDTFNGTSNASAASGSWNASAGRFFENHYVD